MALRLDKKEYQSLNDLFPNCDKYPGAWQLLTPTRAGQHSEQFDTHLSTIITMSSINRNQLL